MNYSTIHNESIAYISFESVYFHGNRRFLSILHIFLEIRFLSYVLKCY